MKNIKKRIAMLMAAMIICVSMEMASVMAAKAAEFDGMSARTWVHCDCGVDVVVSIGHRHRLDSKVKCTWYNHPPNCYVCSGEFWDVYVIRVSQ